VTVLNDAAELVVTRYDSTDTLFYVDPPYPVSVVSERDMYAHEMPGDDQHRALASLLHDVRGMVLISGYDCELYRELYRGWHMAVSDAQDMRGQLKQECLWLSPQAKLRQDYHDLPLFTRKK